MCECFALALLSGSFDMGEAGVADCASQGRPVAPMTHSRRFAKLGIT